jgi:hypothetical protein
MKRLTLLSKGAKEARCASCDQDSLPDNRDGRAQVAPGSQHLLLQQSR